MKVLVIGGGGREAAMVWKLAQSPDTEIFCAPGNAGIAEHATCIPLQATDITGLLSFAKHQKIDLTIVGPEAPLVAGITDRFREADLLICGPSAAAAQAEGSKRWFKGLLVTYDLPTAPFRVFNKPYEALVYINQRGAQSIVIKADGLMGGKGVYLPNSSEEAEQILSKLMVKGSAGERVIIEDRLTGVERSIIAVTDGKTVHMLPFTQDYKREGEGDTGRNTGGMGAHTLDLPSEKSAHLEELLQGVVNALAGAGCPYTGFIYLGVIQTPTGPMILECNCRLGDPETQVILPSIDGDFKELCFAVAEGTLANLPKPTRVKHALCVTLASRDYPDSSNRDDVITGLESLHDMDNVLVFHGGTAQQNGVFTTNQSGRVLTVVGRGDTIASARQAAYQAEARIMYPGKKRRGDIGLLIT